KDDLLPFDIEGTWEAMEECQRLGLAKFIGQQGKLREFCKQKGIHLAAWSPFSSKVTDIGIHFLKGLQNLALLNLEGYFVTAACLDTLAELPALSNLNISRCNFTNNGCEMFSCCNWRDKTCYTVKILVATPGRLRDHVENTAGFATRLMGLLRFMARRGAFELPSE
ncbi:hypothetical protein S83_062915, partial [Arachis hypogaea]